MSDQIQMDLGQFAELLRVAVKNRGEAFAAQWLVDEVRKQPVAFLNFMLTIREAAVSVAAQDGREG